MNIGTKRVSLFFGYCHLARVERWLCHASLASTQASRNDDRRRAVRSTGGREHQLRQLSRFHAGLSTESYACIELYATAEELFNGGE